MRRAKPRQACVELRWATHLEHSCGYLGEAWVAVSIESKSYQRGVSLIELLLAVVVGLLLLAGLGRLLAYSQPLQQSLVRQAERQEHLALLNHLWGELLQGAGARGCLANADNVVNFLNTPWSSLGLLAPVPAVEIVAEPATAPVFAGIRNLAEDSQALVVRGYGAPLAVLSEDLAGERGRAKLFAADSRIDSGDVVMIGDCRQASIFSATSTRHSAGHVRFSWQAGEGSLANSRSGVTQDGREASAILALNEPSFAEGAGPYGPSSSLIYVARSRLWSADRPVYALWQKTLSGNALELVTGVQRLHMRYGAWRRGHGGQMGYFDADSLPLDARIVLLSILLNMTVFDDSGHATDEPESFAMSLAVPLSLPLPLPLSLPLLLPPFEAS